MKKAILAELKKNGFSATARSGRGGYTDSFTFTVKVPEAFTISEADYIKTETEGRAAFRGVYWYTTPAGESIHRDALPYDYEERQPILEETARRAYRDSVANQSGENVAEVFKKAVRAIVTSFNSDHSDSMTDYFDRGFYENVSDWNFEETEPTEAQRADMADFDRKAEEAKQAEEERQRAQYEEWQRQREDDEKRAEIRRQKEKADIW